VSRYVKHSIQQPLSKKLAALSFTITRKRTLAKQRNKRAENHAQAVAATRCSCFNRHSHAQHAVDAGRASYAKEKRNSSRIRSH
jgi:hypothetical protein